MDSTERLLNLALCLADSAGPVTAEDIRARVAGYPPDQDESTFKRMLERDKDLLRGSGLVIDADAEGTYRFDARSSFAAPVELTAEEAAALRAAATALVEDDSFPFRAELRLALAKLSAGVPGTRVNATSSLADERPGAQGAAVSRLAAAARERKRVHFSYTNSLGVSGPRSVEPYGLFLHDGRWYLVGRDTVLSEVRTFAVARADDVVVEPRAPKSPDFDRPADFDIASYTRLPFQYGNAEQGFEAVLEFDAAAATRAPAIAGGHGVFTRDSSRLLWRVEARSVRALAQFVVEHGPGIRLVAPPDAATLMPSLLRKAVQAHG